MRYIDADLLKDDWNENKKMYISVEDAIDAQPTADVRENVKGEWKRVFFENKNENGDSFTITLSQCSICGHNQVGNFNFCPNCGADMRGGYSPKCC